MNQLQKDEITSRYSVEKFGKADLEMILVPGGEYLMGASHREEGSRENERPQHKVTVPDFHLGKYPVTQKQWFDVMSGLPEMGEAFLGDDLPVVNVWLEFALEFCGRLSKMTARSYRLPTEAEWEYACRAGTNTPFSFGETITTDLANYNGTEPVGTSGNGEFRGRTTRTGFFQTGNAFGLCDMHGNVWEWCADTWHETYIGAPNDGSAWMTGGDGGYCVQRGGSWADRAGNCRSAFRVGDIAHNSDNIVGLRVAFSGDKF